MKKKNFFGRLFQAIGRLFDRTAQVARKIAFVGIEVTNELKKYVDDGSLPMIIDLLPPKPEFQQYRQLLEDKLPEVIKQLHISSSCLTTQNRREMLLCVINQLRGMTHNERKQKYLLLAAIITQLLSNISFGESVQVTQEVYNEHYSN